MLTSLHPLSLILSLLYHCTEVDAFHSIPCARTIFERPLSIDGRAFQKPLHYSSTSNSHVADNQQREERRTLYDILGGKPTDSRAELKQKYVALARQSHPDALLQSNNQFHREVPDFTEISQAWRILSDKKERKRYDRALRAKQLTDGLLRWVDKVVAKIFKEDNSNYSDRTVAQMEMEPIMTDISVENFFMTAKDDLDMINKSPSILDKEQDMLEEAIQQDIPVIPSATSHSEVEQLNEALQSVQVAEEMTGKAAEVLRLLELSSALEKRADREALRAADIKKSLHTLACNLKTMTSHAANRSDIEANSSKHMDILREFNNTVAALKQTAVDEVSTRRKEEKKFIKAKAETANAFRKYQDCTQARVEAKQKVEKAQNSVDPAGTRATFDESEVNSAASLKAAQALVDQSNEVLKDSIRKRVEAEVEMKKSKYRLDYRKAALERLTEEVKCRKMERRLSRLRSVTVNDSQSENSATPEVQTEELIMGETSRRLEKIAERLKARALDLRLRAEKSLVVAEDETAGRQHELQDMISGLHP